ncbi:MAG TPA: Gfo/Idh/MocA family oxidoreductase [Candidatus Tumulicola sp.]|jgi:predicted dehydrogenase
MSEPIRLGLIGCGHWGKNYAATIAAMDDVVLAWCADTFAQARERARALHPNVRLTADLHELLAAPDCDAVIVAAPPQQHAAVARAAIAARKPVLVEKPLATTVVEARELAAVARTAGIAAVSGHVYLFHPVVVEILERIRSGKTGRLRFMSASRAFTRLASSEDRPDVDALWDLAPNDLAMFVAFAGALPERVFCAYSAFFRADLADAAFAVLEFPGGLIGELRVSWDYPRRERLVTVVGASEALWFDDDAETKLLCYAGPPVDLAGRRGVAVPCSSVPALTEQIRHFVAVVRSGERIRAPFDFGVDIVRILEALSQSATTGTAVRLS